MKWETGDDFTTGSTFVTEPGKYHMVVGTVIEEPKTKDDKLIPNAKFSVQAVVLAGTNESQVGKQINLMFFGPKAGGKDGGKFSRKKVDRFLLGLGLISEDDLKKSIDVDFDKAQGRQFCVELIDNEQNGKKYLDVKGAEIYHVDDREVKDWPKSKQALGYLDKSQRKQPATVAAGVDASSLDL